MPLKSKANIHVHDSGTVLRASARNSERNVHKSSRLEPTLPPSQLCALCLCLNANGIDTLSSSLVLEVEGELLFWQWRAHSVQVALKQTCILLRNRSVCGVSVARTHHCAPVRSLFWLQEPLCFSPRLVPASSPLKRAVLGDAVSASRSLRAEAWLHR